MRHIQSEDDMIRIWHLVPTSGISTTYVMIKLRLSWIGGVQSGLGGVNREWDSNDPSAITGNIVMG